MKYRKLPVVIDAVQWKGDNYWSDLHDFIKCKHAISESGEEILIKTLEGVMHASIGDYIIRGVNGEFYPCKPDIFEKTYEEVY